MDAIKIVVCGDSFCASNELYNPPNGHFSQLLRDRYGYRVINLAHGGFSNLAILWQIREAVSINPQVIVYNQTWSSRLNIAHGPTTEAAGGLRNFIYYNTHNTSASYRNAGTMEKGSVISTPVDGIDQSPFFTLTQEQIQAARLYIKYFYHPGVTEEVDDWLFDYWHQRIVSAGIIPLKFGDNDIGRVAYEFSQSNPSFDSPYHTDLQTQEVIAENIHKKLNQ